MASPRADRKLVANAIVTIRATRDDGKPGFDWRGRRVRLTPKMVMVLGSDRRIAYTFARQGLDLTEVPANPYSRYRYTLSHVIMIDE